MAKPAKHDQRCPICGAPTTREVRPFCSRRCADIDLGRWLRGSYRVPTDEPPGTDRPGTDRPGTDRPGRDDDDGV